MFEYKWQYKFIATYPYLGSVAFLPFMSSASGISSSFGLIVYPAADNPFRRKKRKKDTRPKLYHRG
jgi:hypothetical protein